MLLTRADRVRVLDREFKYARRGKYVTVKVVYEYLNYEYHTLVFLRDTIDGLADFSLHGKADDWQVTAVVDAYYCGIDTGFREGRARAADTLLVAIDELRQYSSEQREIEARSKR